MVSAIDETVALRTTGVFLMSSRGINQVWLRELGSELMQEEAYWRCMVPQSFSSVEKKPHGKKD